MSNESTKSSDPKTPSDHSTGMEMDRSTGEEKTTKTKKVTFASKQANAPEEGFQKFFMNPMLSELEDRVKENTEILDKINKQMEDERRARLKERQTSHIPEPLKGSGQEIGDIMKKVEDLILFGTYDDDDEEEPQKPSCLQTLDEHGRLAITAHSVAAYISTLTSDNLKHFTAKVTSDCQLWLSRMLRFSEESSVVYHEESREGLARICRLALYQKFPKYATEGFEALYSRPPVIYVSAASMSGIGSYLCLQLGLPMSCISIVPCNTMYGANSKMDVSMLEKLITDDIAAAKTPTLLSAFAGTPVLGHVDTLHRLQELCKKHTIWLHVEGNSLATLAMISVPTPVQPAKSGDSMTISLGRWLGIPGLPHATLFKAADPALVHAAGLNTFNPQLKLNCLPIWICLQSLGHDGIVGRVKKSCDLAKLLFEKMEPISTIKAVSKEKKVEEKKDKVTVGDLISKALSALLVFEIVTPTVVFKYFTDTKSAGSEVAKYAVTVTEEQQEEEEKRAVYFDALNVWLAETLQSDNPKVDIHAVDVEKEGICIRYAPLESAQVLGTSEEDVETLAHSLESQVAILDATVSARSKFETIVDAQDKLQYVEIPNWAGLGAVQYIPDSCIEGELTDQGKREWNTINVELVHKLKSMDTAFSLGHVGGELTCVRFGLITKDTDIEELIGLVYALGKEVEESSRYIETMSQVIKKGIEEANDGLKTENNNRLSQEGVLRQVPLVGSLLNWWSPPPKDLMKGRTFNLASGRISSTADTYKYHLQVQEDTTSPPTSPTSYKDSLKHVEGEVTPQASDLNSPNRVEPVEEACELTEDTVVIGSNETEEESGPVSN
ncbi:hypothetical protein ScPMuIL_004070 [Solemya velum]